MFTLSRPIRTDQEANGAAFDSADRSVTPGDPGRHLVWQEFAPRATFPSALPLHAWWRLATFSGHRQRLCRRHQRAARHSHCLRWQAGRQACSRCAARGSFARKPASLVRHCSALLLLLSAYLSPEHSDSALSSREQLHLTNAVAPCTNYHPGALSKFWQVR